MTSIENKIEKGAFSDTSESSSGDELEWSDVAPDQEEPPAIISLVDDKVFSDVTSMLDHCTKTTSFDFLATCKQLTLDFYGTVKLVNFSKTQPHLWRWPPTDRVCAIN